MSPSPRPPARASRAVLRPLLVLALVFATGHGVVGAADDLTASYPGANVRWTLPNFEYTWQELSSIDKDAGSFARAVSDDKNVVAIGTSSPTGGLSVDERIEEMRSSLAAFASAGVRTTVRRPTVLAGIDGQVVILAGETKHDTSIQIRGYAIERDGTFYHLILLIQNDVHETRLDELNALRDGFQLIKGGGTKTVTETFTEAGSAPRSEQRDDGASDQEPWPADGPVREGNKLTFTGYNLEWTLPANGPFSWRSPIRDIKNAFQRDGNRTSISPVVHVMASVERTKGEFDPEDAPKSNVLQGYLVLFELAGQHDPADFVRSPEFDRLIPEIYGFSEVASTGSQIRPIDLGNGKAIMVTREGTRADGRTASAVFIETVLRGWLYRWIFTIEGYEKDRTRTFGRPLAELMKGVRFIEATDFVAGPLVPTDGLATFTGSRGIGLGEETQLALPGFSWAPRTASSLGGYTETDGWTFKKSKAFAQLALAQPKSQGLQMAIEGRTPDGQGYVYFSIWAEAAARLQNERKEPESIIDDHAKAWLAGLGDTAKCSKSGKPPYHRQGAFEGEKGLKYEFTARFKDVPYVEEGYVFKHKQTTYWVRLQIGGNPADKGVKDLVNSVKKGFAWAR